MPAGIKAEFHKDDFWVPNPTTDDSQATHLCPRKFPESLRGEKKRSSIVCKDVHNLKLQQNGLPLKSHTPKLANIPVITTPLLPVL